MSTPRFQQPNLEGTVCFYYVIIYRNTTCQRCGHVLFFYYHFLYFILIENQSKLENNTHSICVNALELCKEL